MVVGCPRRPHPEVRESDPTNGGGPALANATVAQQLHSGAKVHTYLEIARSMAAWQRSTVVSVQQ